MSKLWIDKYRTHKYDPIVIRLSNGSSLRLCVGNGFDGSSGFYFKGPKHGDAPEIIPNGLWSRAKSPAVVCQGGDGS